MNALDLNRLQAHRTQTFHLSSAARLTTPNQALHFVNERGFVYFWPIKGVTLPTLWVAARVTARCRTSTMILAWSPGAGRMIHSANASGITVKSYTAGHFYFPGSRPVFLRPFRELRFPRGGLPAGLRGGRLTQAAKQIYATLLDKGSLDTISLRKEARLLNAKESVFTAPWKTCRRISRSCRWSGRSGRLEICLPL